MSAAATLPERVRAAYSRLFYAHIAVPVLTTLIAWSFWEHPARSTALWIVATLDVVAAVAFAVSLAYRRRGTDERAVLWARVLDIGSTVYGAFWGVCGVVLISIGDVEQDVIAALLCGGLAAGVLTTHVTMPRALHGLHVTTVVPVIVALLSDGVRASSIVAASLIAYLVALTLIARVGMRQFQRMLELRIRNERLIDELAVAHRRAVAASEAKSRFVANMSHEIRTPLNGLLGMAEVMSGTPLTEEQRQSVTVIRHTGEILLRVVSDVLDFSKVESGHLELECAPMSVHAVISGAVGLYAPTAAAKGVALESEVLDDVPRRLVGDSVRLGQIVNNLVNNAIKFTQQGRVRITCSSRSVGDDVVAVSIDVEDTGPGIPADALDRIFDAFAQQDSSTTRRFGGTGLGLPICRQLVAAMGGELAVDSEVGRGSRFTVTMRMPVAPPDAPAEHVEPTPVPPPSAGDPRPRVLVVDDNEYNLRVLDRMLQRLHADAVAACDGAEALDALRSGQFDVVLMDWHMPDMDGLETTRKIRELEADSGRTPVIAMTASVTDGDREACLESGMDDFIAKPVRLADLRRVFEAWLRQREP